MKSIYTKQSNDVKYDPKQPSTLRNKAKTTKFI